MLCRSPRTLPPMSTMRTPFGDNVLSLWPPTTDKSLRAWDAADELLLNHLSEYCLTSSEGGKAVLLCNDSHGALSCALHSQSLQVWSDSFLAHTSIRKNWRANQLPGEPNCIDSMNTPDRAMDLVLIKLPKTHALLEDQLARLRPRLHARTVIIAASLVRHLRPSVFALFERYIGPATTSLAQKKARLLFCEFDPSLNPPVSPYPDTYSDKDLNLTMVNHANVFCRDRVDIGARFFLSQCHKLPVVNDIVDLACGNGILGISVQKLQPHARLHFIDESYMAIASTKTNFTRLIEAPDTKSPLFLVCHGLTQLDNGMADLIICNPPFHLQHAVNDDTAQGFFKHAARCLKADGQLWVVANRHLPYRNYLNRIFKRCDEVAANAKFVLLRASEQKLPYESVVS